MKPEEGKPHVLNYRTYFRVWVGLIILTGVTVSIGGMQLGRWAILLPLLIAGTKSGLVLGYFMHLRYERLRIFRVIIPMTLVVLLVFILLTFSDVAFRWGGAR
ncbi:MAG: cytochrome C oxidase subunit IV family protein [Thermodesulfobacteriota bacterium]